MVLAWAEDESVSIEEVRSRQRWEGCHWARLIGTNLYLVRVAEIAARPGSASPPERNLDPTSEDSRRQIAERKLALARGAGDARRELAASHDLAVAIMKEGDFCRAQRLLGESLEAARRIADRGMEVGILVDLGRVALEWGGRVTRGRSCLGDRVREGNCARAAVERMRHLGRPQAEWFARHLVEFQSGEQTSLASMQGGAGASYLSSTNDAGVISPSTRVDAAGPLRMSLTAAGAMTKFVGSGSRASDREMSRSRLEACSSFEHHTDLRCRHCGCFTAAKARMHHERCPIGRWR